MVAVGQETDMDPYENLFGLNSYRANPDFQRHPCSTLLHEKGITELLTQKHMYPMLAFLIAFCFFLCCGSCRHGQFVCECL